MPQVTEQVRQAVIAAADAAKAKGLFAAHAATPKTLAEIAKRAFDATAAAYRADELSDRTIVILVKAAMVAIAVNAGCEESYASRVVGIALRKAKLVEQAERDPQQPTSTGCQMAVAAYDSITGRGRKPNVKELRAAAWTLGQIALNESKGGGLTIGRARKLAVVVIPMTSAEADAKEQRKAA